MRGVRWRRLVLHGFGRFGGSVELALGPGMNVHVAPNETGKSTLVAGLAAVLFGLPAIADPERFGTGRWRHWAGAPRFAGQLELEAAGNAFRIQRDFATHRIRVARWSEQGWEELFAGEHNPAARRRHGRYETFLMETVGIASRDLFLSTFALAQPLPDPKALDGEIQQLLSGAGTAPYRRALERLVTDVRVRTRFSRDLGVTERNAQKDGQLEELEAEIAQLEADIAQSRAAADSLEVIQAELNRQARREKEARARAEEAAASLAAWTHWRTLLLRRRTLLREQGQLTRAWETVQKLEEAREEGERRLAAEFPELAATADADELGRRLERLQQLEERIATAREAVARELAGLKERAAELVREWQAYEAQRERLAALETELEERYGFFAAADPGLRERLAGYTAHLLRLEREVEACQDALAAWREPHQRYGAERDRFEQSFADLAGWGDDAVEAVDRRLALLEQHGAAAARVRALGAELGEARRRHRLATGLLWTGGALMSALLAGLLATRLNPAGPSWLGWTGAGAVLALVLAALVVGSRRLASPVRALQVRLKQAEGELAALEQSLAADPRFDGLNNPAQLGALRERLLARAQAAAALAELGEELPHPDQEQVLMARLDQARQALEEFRAATADARQRFGDDIEGAFRRWTSLMQEVAGVRAGLVSFVRRHAGLETPAAEAVPVDRLPGLWGELARLVTAAGRPVATWGQLAGRLEALPEEFWVQALSVREGEEPLAGWLAEAAELRTRLAAVLAAGDGSVAAARRRWTAWRTAREELARHERERAGLLAAHGVASAAALHERLLDITNQGAALWRQLEEWSAAHPGLPRPEEADDPDALDVRLKELTDNRDRWQAEADGAAAETRRLLQEQARLTGGSVINIAQAEEALQERRRRQEALTLEVRAMARAHQELAAAVQEYQETHRVRLAAAAQEYFQRFTGVPRRVELDEHFAVSLREPDGTPCAVAQLSQGAQDQLYLALRLAIADLVGGDVSLPMLLDDPFVNCDAQRLERIRQALTEASRERQIVLFSHRDDFTTWGVPASVDESG